LPKQPSRRKSPPRRKATAPPKLSRAVTRDMGNQGPLMNQLHLRCQADPGEYATLPLMRHTSGGWYLRHVQGTARGGVVKWVRGVLLSPSEPIPAAPPEHAAEAILSVGREGQTDYVFTKSKKTPGRAYPGLGPVRPGSLVRVVVWAGFESDSTGGRGVAARRAKKRSAETILLADEIPTLMAGEPPTRLLGAASTAPPATNIVHPPDLGTVPMLPSGPAIVCQLQNSLSTSPPLTRVLALVFNTQAAADAAKQAPGPTGGSPTNVNPAAQSAKCVAVGAQKGTDNWIVAWAQHSQVGVWVLCGGSGRRVTVT